MDIWYERLFLTCLLVLSVIIVIYVIRSIVGPTLADRILSVNAIGTLTIVAIAVLAVSKQESYLMDVCLIYAMLSFLAIIVLTAFVTRENLELQELEEHPEEITDDAMQALVEEHRARELREQAAKRFEEAREQAPEREEEEPEEAGFMEEWKNSLAPGPEAGLPEESDVDEEEPEKSGRLSAESALEDSMVRSAIRYLEEHRKEDE